MPTRVVLLGAGHAHLEVVRRAAELRVVGARVTLVAPRAFRYSGMASAVAGGAVGPAANRIDVGRLAARHEVEHVAGLAVDRDPGRRVLRLGDGREVGYDVLSVNVGSRASTAGVEVGAGAWAAKPLGALAALPSRVGPGTRVCVVGAGASGCELAGNLAARGAAVTLLGRSERLLGVAGEDVARHVARVLARRGVALRLGEAATAVDAHGVTTTTGRVPAEVAVLATGLVAATAVTDLGLGGDDGMPVDERLAHVTEDGVLGAGDAIRFGPRPLPRLGVYGVRAAPVLLHNLVATVANGGARAAFDPGEDALAVLDLGAGHGVAMRSGRWVAGRGALLAKRAIDRGWLARYR